MRLRALLPILVLLLSLSPHPTFGRFNTLILGDFGTGDDNQRAVAEAMTQLIRGGGEDPPAFVIATGDNIYEDGVRSLSDPSFDTKFRDVYASDELQIPWYMTLGNHDYHIPTSPEDEIAFSHNYTTQWTMPAHYYAVRYNLLTGSKISLTDDQTAYSVLLVVIDTILLCDRGDAERETQLQWLDDLLNQTAATYILISGHYPVYSAGDHGSTPCLLQHLRPRLEEHAVTAYLCGHEHDLQMLSANGISYVVSGAGGRHLHTLPFRINQTLWQQPTFGFVRASFDIDDLEWTFKFFDTSADVLFTSTTSLRHHDPFVRLVTLWPLAVCVALSIAGMIAVVVYRKRHSPAERSERSTASGVELEALAPELSSPTAAADTTISVSAAPTAICTEVDDGGLEGNALLDGMDVDDDDEEM